MAINPATGVDDGTATAAPTGSAAPTAIATPTPTSASSGASTTPQTTANPTADRVNGLLSAGNPYIEQAKSAGMDLANSRGLLNSSIAAGASQKAAYDAAVPIATNDANIGATKDLQTSQIASTQAIATAGNVSSEKIANLNATTQTGIAQMNIDASAKQQAAAILSQEKISGNQIASQQAIAALNISDADKQQLLSLAAQQRIANTQQSTSLQVANMNVSSDQQDKAAAAALGYAQNYASMVNSINGNANIPADARTAYLANAKTLYDNGMGLVEQTYNVNLDWGFGAPASPAPSYTGGATAAAPAATSASPNYSPAAAAAQRQAAATSPNFDNTSLNPGVAYTDPGGNQFDGSGNFLGRI
jgi:hypothetical protein